MSIPVARILIVETENPAALAILRAPPSLGVMLFAADPNSKAEGLRRVCLGRSLVIPKACHLAFVPILLAFCEEHGIDVLLPTTRGSALALLKARPEFEAAGVRIAGASQQCVTRCEDRSLLYQTLRGSQWLPEWTVFDSHFQSRDWPYPIDLAPRCGPNSTTVVHRGVRLLSVNRDGSSIVREHLPGAEYSVHVLSRPGGNCMVAIPVEHIPAEGSYPALTRTVRDVELQRAGVDVAEAVGSDFVCEVRFKRDASGKPKVIAVIPWLPAALPLIVMAGVNLSELVVGLALRPSMPVSANALWFRELGMVETSANLVPVQQWLRAG